MKKRLLCPSLPKPGCPTSLNENEAHHATHVLRLRDGDIIEAMDGQGNHRLATLRVLRGKPCLEYLESTPPSASTRPQMPHLPIILEMGIIKGEAMEWIVEKAVELGVQRLIPVVTNHTVVQMKKKGPKAFQERWQKIADQALKQCGRLHRLEVDLPIPLEDVLSQRPPTSKMTRLWCDETSTGESPYLLNWLLTHPLPPSGTIHLLIGPEGGWSSQEKSLLTQEVSISHPGLQVECYRIDLGPQILRAETAAVFGASLLTSFGLNSHYGPKFSQ